MRLFINLSTAAQFQVLLQRSSAFRGKTTNGMMRVNQSIFGLTLLLFSLQVHCEDNYSQLIEQEYATAKARLSNLEASYKGHLADRYLRSLRVAASLKSQDAALLVRLSTIYARVISERTADAVMKGKMIDDMFKQKFFHQKPEKYNFAFHKLAKVFIKYIDWISQQASRLRVKKYNEEAALIIQHFLEDSPGDSFKEYAYFFALKFQLYEHQNDEAYRSFELEMESLSGIPESEALFVTSRDEVVKPLFVDFLLMKTYDVSNTWMEKLHIVSVFVAYDVQTDPFLKDLSIRNKEFGKLTFDEYLMQLASRAATESNGLIERLQGGDLYCPNSAQLDDIASFELIRSEQVFKAELLEPTNVEFLSCLRRLVYDLTELESEIAHKNRLAASLCSQAWIMDELEQTTHKALFTRRFHELCDAIATDGFIEISVIRRFKSLLKDLVEKTLGSQDEFRFVFNIPFEQKRVMMNISGMVFVFVYHAALEARAKANNQTWKDSLVISTALKAERKQWPKLINLLSDLLELRVSTLSLKLRSKEAFTQEFNKMFSKHTPIDLSFFAAMNHIALFQWCASFLELGSKSRLPAFDVLLYRQCEGKFKGISGLG